MIDEIDRSSPSVGGAAPQGAPHLSQRHSQKSTEVAQWRTWDIVPVFVVGVCLGCGLQKLVLNFSQASGTANAAGADGASTPFGVLLQCRLQLHDAPKGECVQVLAKALNYPERHRSPRPAAPPEVVLPILRRLESRQGPETFFRLLLDTVRPGKVMTIVDVGANRGTFSMQAAARGHRVIAFEPNPTNIRAFRQLLPSTKYPRVRLVTKGLGEKPSSVLIRGNSGGRAAFDKNLGVVYDGGATITKSCNRSRLSCSQIEISTLDAEVREHVFVAKMDIQGFETFALRGAKALIAHHGVDVFILEFDPRMQKAQGGSCLEILQTLHRAGYVLLENGRLVFDKGVPVFSYDRNFGPPMSFPQFVKALNGAHGYTDLVAVHHSLYPPVDARPF